MADPESDKYYQIVKKHAESENAEALGISAATEEEIAAMVGKPTIPAVSDIFILFFFYIFVTFFILVNLGVQCDPLANNIPFKPMRLFT